MGTALVGWLFLIIEPEVGPEALTSIHRHLHDAVGAFDPWSLFAYIFDAVQFLDRLVRFALYYVLINGLSKATVFAVLDEVSKIGMVVYYPLAVLVLPITVVVEIVGHHDILAGVLTACCWIAMVPLTRKLVGEESGFLFVLFLVVEIFAFLWLVKLTMLAVDRLLPGEVASTVASSSAGISMFASGLFWCAMKVSERSVTERLIDLTKRAVEKRFLR